MPAARRQRRGDVAAQHREIITSVAVAKVHGVLKVPTARDLRRREQLRSSGAVDPVLTTPSFAFATWNLKAQADLHPEQARRSAQTNQSTGAYPDTEGDSLMALSSSPSSPQAGSQAAPAVGRRRRRASRAVAVR